MELPLDPSAINNWPAAIVAVVLLLLLLGPTSIATWRNSVAVKKQVRNNGGASLKDAIDRIEKAQQEQGQALADHVAESSSWRASIEDELSARPRPFWRR